jgi:biotin transport system permease protein
MKLAVVALVTTVMVTLSTPWQAGLAVLLTAVLYLCCGVPLVRAGLRALRPLWLFALLIMVWHLIIADPWTGLTLLGRIVTAVGVANLATMTTRFDDMLATLTTVLAPTRALGLQPKLLGFAMALVVRFTPMVCARGEQLAEGWRARSPKPARWQIVVPLALSTIDDAERVAEALRARGGVPRDP